jgi:hypothetical protein
VSTQEIHAALLAAAMEAYDRTFHPRPGSECRAAFEVHARDRLGQVAQAVSIEIDMAREGDR